MRRNKYFEVVKAEKKRKRNELLAFGLVCIMSLAMPLLCYVMVTQELCNRIGQGVYDTQTQESMKLSPEICAKPWHAKL